MAKYLNDSVLDAALNTIKNGAVRLHICDGQPNNYAGISALQLAIATIDSDDFTGPTDGDSSGRKLTMNQQTGIEILETGDADHVALSDNSAVLFLVTTLTQQTVTDGNTATVNAFKLEFADAS